MGGDSEEPGDKPNLCLQPSAYISISYQKKGLNKAL